MRIKDSGCTIKDRVDDAANNAHPCLTGYNKLTRVIYQNSFFITVAQKIYYYRHTQLYNPKLLFTALFTRFWSLKFHVAKSRETPALCAQENILRLQCRGFLFPSRTHPFDDLSN